MSIQRIVTDVNPRFMQMLKTSNVTKTAQGVVETFKDGTKLISKDGGRRQYVYDAKGNLICTQIQDSNGKTYIV